MQVTRNTLACDHLITPHALFSPTYLLNLVQLEIAPFDPPTPKTPPQNETRSEPHDLSRRYRHLNFPRWRPGAAAILDLIKPEIAPFDPPDPKTPP